MQSIILLGVLGALGGATECQSDEHALLQLNRFQGAQKSDHTENPCALQAYWEFGNCGCGGNDQNAGWCGGIRSGQCPETIQTTVCPSGTASLATFSGQGGVGATRGASTNWNHDGCEFIWHAQYACEPEPSHYIAVTSWPFHAWGAWNSEARGSAIEKCMSKEQTQDAEGEGILFTSCCSADGEGMGRQCSTTRNTDFSSAAALCAEQGGRLCTAEESLAIDSRGTAATASRGCSVDGPPSASGANLNRHWTSTPCAPPYSFVHQGHCAGGWLNGLNSYQTDVDTCSAHCRATSGCKYFAFCDGGACDGSTNCALYNEAAGCPDDNNWGDYNAYVNH